MKTNSINEYANGTMDVTVVSRYDQEQLSRTMVEDPKSFSERTCSWATYESQPLVTVSYQYQVRSTIYRSTAAQK